VIIVKLAGYNDLTTSKTSRHDVIQKLVNARNAISANVGMFVRGRRSAGIRISARRIRFRGARDLHVFEPALRPALTTPRSGELVLPCDLGSNRNSVVFR
jgi:hypothetical protein